VWRASPAVRACIRSHSSSVGDLALALPFFLNALLEIAIALAFLHSLLGRAAFAGLAVLALGWPLNAAITRRGVTIQNRVLAARDARMAVVSELLGAIKPIVRAFAAPRARR
jgi:hypothetical protein